jgi:hypothetical protein
LCQQTDEPFHVRLHLAGDAQGEFLSRTAFPELEALTPGKAWRVAMGRQIGLTPEQ